MDEQTGMARRLQRREGDRLVTADGRQLCLGDAAPRRPIVRELELDVRHRELRFRGERVHLSPREQALTELLMARSGRVVPKDHIVSTLSSWETDFSENSVEVYIHRLRKRFADLGVTIKTVRGFGYLMELTAEPGAAPAPADG